MFQKTCFGGYYQMHFLLNDWNKWIQFQMKFETTEARKTQLFTLEMDHTFNDSKKSVT